VLPFLPSNVPLSWSFHAPFLVAMVVPTGVGAAQGGFGGDATPWLNLLASCCDGLITHPNVANAAQFQKLPQNAWYVEGFLLDQWAMGRCTLDPPPPTGRRLGVVMDAGIPGDMQTLHHNVLGALRAVYGVSIVTVEITREPLAISLIQQGSGASSGALDNPDVLLEAARTCQAQGADAVVILGLMEPKTVATPNGQEAPTLEADYLNGQGVDPIGGVEAILSHLVVAHVGIPAAHVPVFSWETAHPVLDKLLAPKVAAEFITPSFAACVFLGLQQAPTPCWETQTGVAFDALSAVVTPVDALGGPMVLRALELGIPVLPVASNQTVLNTTLETLLGDQEVARRRQAGQIRPVANYLEAAGMLQLMRLGMHGVLGVAE
jgi:hypothetical protein